MKINRAEPQPWCLAHFAAPRELVFKAWSSAEHIKRWFSPAGFSVPDAEVDFVPVASLPAHASARWGELLVTGPVR